MSGSAGDRGGAPGEPRVRRVRGPGITGLEVWNRPLPDGLFWERVGTPRVESLRDQGRPEGEIGQILVDSLVPALRGLHDELRFDVAYLGGGLVEIEGVASALREASLPFPVAISPAPAFVGERGGVALLQQAGRPGGVVLDVGQTGIKGSCRGMRVTRLRDCRMLPLELIDPSGRKPRPSPERVSRAAGLIADAFGAVLDRARAADPTVVLALPCSIGDDLVPGACTYGWEGDGRLLPAIAERLEARAGSGLDVLVLNDAELAAESARADLAAAPGERILCLTLGFCPGGSLLTT